MAMGGALHLADWCLAIPSLSLCVQKALEVLLVKGCICKPCVCVYGQESHCVCACVCVFIVIPSVHNETKCHIHFPDSNRFYGPKNNQVSVTGQATGVEAARQRIRVSHMTVT